MKLLGNTSLGAKLWMALGVVILLLVFTLAVATARTNALVELQNRETTQYVAKLSQMARWVALAHTNLARLTAGLSSPDPTLTVLFKDAMVADMTEIAAIQKAVGDMPMEPASKALVAQIDADRTAMVAMLTKVRDAQAAGDQAAIDQAMQNQFVPAAAKYAASLDALMGRQAEVYAALKADFLMLRDGNAGFARIVVGALIAVLILGTFFLIRQIRKPLQDAIAVAQTIAGGDLSGKIAVDRGDEFGEMMRAIAHMRDQLVRLVADVRQGTDGMAVASEEIATGNNDLSVRTEQTASNLQQTASSMAQLTATVKQSADSARQANQLAASAAQVAQRGGQVVSQVVTTMDDINASSRKIADIISVIDGIAFQTNILALNAAVEAARAGEQGRGFAVVASEVRSLAGRSAEAAKEIKLLINTSVQKVDGGATLVAQAGQTMTEIVGSVQRVTDIMGEITTAASEQSDGIAQVNGAIGQLDQMTQQNAALVEQSAAAASSMKDQAQRLAQVVASFKLDGSNVVSRVAASPAMAPAPRRASPPYMATPKSLPTSAKALVPKPAALKAPAPKALAKPTAGLPRPTPPAARKPAPAGGDDDWETF
ncbi:MAG: methyl-accepting chemotaxis protein [Rhodoferax sp.]|nr:methyl-accepting chemotaxis protein [Rhodoferax sp.]